MLSIAQAAEFLGVDRKTVWRAPLKKHLSLSTHAGGHRGFRERDIRALLCVR
jgi:hypothetical protein